MVLVGEASYLAVALHRAGCRVGPCNGLTCHRRGGGGGRGGSVEIGNGMLGHWNPRHSVEEILV